MFETTSYNDSLDTRSKKSYKFDIDQELNFHSFDAERNIIHDITHNLAYGNVTAGVHKLYNPNVYQKASKIPDEIVDDYDNEPPLLEELGINPSQIFRKTIAVLNPTRAIHQDILEDTDIAGPLVFCLALASILLLAGKVTFSYIYGIGAVGCVGFYTLLSLMASQSEVTFGAVVSVLGYSLLPMVALSGINLIFTIQGNIGLIITGVCILWSSLSASKLFVTAYSMDHQQLLIAYPCALLYGVFALIIIF